MNNGLDTSKEDRVCFQRTETLRYDGGVAKLDLPKKVDHHDCSVSIMRSGLEFFSYPNVRHHASNHANNEASFHD